MELANEIGLIANKYAIHLESFLFNVRNSILNVQVLIMIIVKEILHF